MKRASVLFLTALASVAGLLATGCRNHMPHAFGPWPAGGDIQQTHAKPPEGGYYSNWDPFAADIEITPIEDVNPVRTQHFLIATVKDKNGKPLPNRRVEWIINDGSVGDIVEVDESGWRASRGYKVTNDYAISHTNNFDHRLDMGTSDPSDDIALKAGQTWCVITSAIEGDTHVTAYAPGIYDRSKHKVFAVKHWYDVRWDCPPSSEGPIALGKSYNLVTKVTKYSNGEALPGYIVTYKITGGSAGATFANGQTTATVNTDGGGLASIAITAGKEGDASVVVDIMRPENVQCCKPAVHIATCNLTRSWVGPKIACDKRGPATVLAGETFEYIITVSNPSQVEATGVTVSDSLPAGVTMVSSNPAGSGSWSLGTIPPGGSSSVSITAKATQTGRFENCAEAKADGGLQTRCCVTTVASSPKLVIEKRCTAEVTPCDTIEYVVVVKNTGDGPAKNVQFMDTLPPGIVTTDGKTSLQASLGDLGAGEAKEIRFTGKAEKSGSYVNKAVATADGGLTTEASCTTVVKTPGLKVTKTSGRPETYIGRPNEFTITVTNTGDTFAMDTTLVDPIPAGWQFISADGGGTMSGNQVTWKLGNLNAGESKNVKITLKAMNAGAGKNVASATAKCAQGAADVPTNVVGIAAILLEVIDVADPIEVGSTETYRIEVTNQGSADDTNIVITVILPPEMEFVAADGPTKGTASGKNITFAPLPSLAPKAKVTWTVQAKGTAPGDIRLKTVLNSDVTKSAPVEETESTHIY
jgi:uncharacterized repeat protein (TIGR01451 family)